MTSKASHFGVVRHPFGREFLASSGIGMTEKNSILKTPAAARSALLNSQTRVLQTYDSHRNQIMNLIAQQLNHAAACSPSSELKIAILGAGNCLDLDLTELTRDFGLVQLIDLDPAALEFAVSCQLSADLHRIRRHAPIDLAAPLASLTPESIADAQNVETTCEQLTSLLETVPFSENDVVVSTCVLSQMIGAITNVSTEQHSHYLRLLQSLRRGHFRRMLQLLRPGGRGLFVTDVVSSESVPSLVEIEESSLPRILAECLSAGNFFSGLNPGVALQDFKSYEPIASLCRDVQIHAPWLWKMGPRVYAVYAISFALEAQ